MASLNKNGHYLRLLAMIALHVVGHKPFIHQQERAADQKKSAYEDQMTIDESVVLWRRFYTREFLFCSPST